LLNRAGGHGDLPASDIEKVLGRPYWSIPNDHRPVGDSVNQGVPVAELFPKSAVARALVKLAESLAPGGEGVEGKRRRWHLFGG
jgi:pilus assembly protein CpaE